MALGSNNTFSGGPLIFLTPRSKDKNKQEVPPHFTVGRSVGDKIVDDTETVTSVSGDLIKVDFKQREFEGNVSEEAVFYLRDKAAGEHGETYRVPIRFGMPGRGLFNKMAVLTEKGDFSGLKIDYYRNRNGYETFGLEQRGEKVKWKYENKDLPQPLEIKHPTTQKVLQRDYTEVNALFKKELEAIAAKVNKAAPATEKAAAPAEEAKTVAKEPAKPVTNQRRTAAKATEKPKPVTTENLDEDIPF